MRITTTELVGIFLATVLITSLTTPLVRKIAYAKDITDKPDGVTKLQQKPVAYLGGIAVTIGFTLSIISASMIGKANTREWILIIGVLLPAFTMALLGLIDDLMNLGIKIRFILQTITAIFTSLLMLQITDTRVTLITGILNFVLAIIWIVGITNTFNLLDNMNGLASGSSALSFLFFGLLAYFSEQHLVAGFSFALAAACIGFIFFNFPKASIYLGDSGTLFLGFLAAVVSLRLDLKLDSEWLSIFIRFLILFLPITDTATVIISRLRRRVSPFKGGLDHLSHRINTKLSSKTKTVLLLWIFQIGISTVATFLFLSNKN